MRLIDASKLQMELLMSRQTHAQNERENQLMERDAVIVQEQPTVDAVEVVHAHWTNDEYDYYDCSNCGEAYYNGAASTMESNHWLENGEVYQYCPQCGAKMDGKSDISAVMPFKPYKEGGADDIKRR